MTPADVTEITSDAKDLIEILRALNCPTGARFTAANAIEDLVGKLAAQTARAEAAEARADDAIGELSALSSLYGAGLGDDKTTAAEFVARIKWGVDFIVNAEANRRKAAGARVEELTAKLEAAPVQVGVKPLEWVATRVLRKYLVDGEVVIEFTTKGQFLYTLTKNYQIGLSWSAHRGRNTSIAGGTCVTLESAKAAAQADYETRIRSALIATPAPSPDVGALLAALGAEYTLDHPLETSEERMGRTDAWHQPFWPVEGSTI